MSRRSGGTHRQLTILCALLAAVLLISVAAAHPGAKTKDIQQLTWGLAAPIRSLEYTHSADSGSSTVISLGCETLVRYDSRGRLRPGLATSFKTPDPSTYIYTIRRNVRFWDGTTLTPADIVYSLERAASAKAGSQIAALYTSVRSIRADGNNVVIKLKAPNAYFRYSPAVTYILQKKYWQANLADIGMPQKLTMCTGPYRFTRYKGAETIDLVAFDNYWGGRPSVRAITLKVIVNDATRLLAMRQGEIDGSFRIPPESIDQWRKLSNTRVQLAPELRMTFLSLDTAVAPWNDVHVRRAVAHAVDKRGLVRAVLRGYGSVAHTLPPPEQWGDLLTPAQVTAFYKTIPRYPFNLANAREELAQSAFPNGFEATIPYPDSQQALGKAALALSQNLKQIGVDLKVTEVPTNAYYAKLLSHPSPLGPQIVAWGVDYPDPADVLHFISDSKSAVQNAFNLANFKSGEMDRLLARQERSVDPKVRAAAIKKALLIVARRAPYIPLWYSDVAMAVSDKLAYKDFGTWYVYTPWALNVSTR